MRKSLAQYFGIQIFDWCNNSMDTGLEECVSAWWRAAVVRMWFERNVGRAA
jgi:hypothetical protein